MRVLRPEDFEKLARVVVDEYLANSTPLEQGVVKTALKNELNPDQIKNLVQQANTMAHLTLFDKKADGDKIIDFEPADPSLVLKRIYNDTPEKIACVMPDSPESATDMFGDLPELKDRIHEMIGESDASLLENGGDIIKSAAAPLSSTKKQSLIINIRKVASALNDSKLQRAWEYKEEMDKLASVFAKLYGPDHDVFEKDALCARGAAAVPILGDIRCCLRMGGSPDIAHAKLARVVDTNTAEFKSFDRLLKLSQAYNEAGAAYQYVEREFGAWL